MNTTVPTKPYNTLCHFSNMIKILHYSVHLHSGVIQHFLLFFAKESHSRVIPEIETDSQDGVRNSGPKRKNAVGYFLKYFIKRFPGD